MPFPPKSDESAAAAPPPFAKKSAKKGGRRPLGKKDRKAAPAQKSMMQSGRSFGRR